MQDDPYFGREQTKAKHFILRTYLQALAFKVLHISDVAFVDGFSGPWETRTENFADSSFMIAIEVLKDAQQKLAAGGIHRTVRCFLCERNPRAFKQLAAAVRPYDNPQAGIEIRPFEGKFEDAVSEIQKFIGNSFPVIFIDPTGWTGYPFDKIGPLLAQRRCEVLINFMYDFINRFAYDDDEQTVLSLSPILGGPDWPTRLEPNLSRGAAVEKLFRETLKKVGQFNFVVSTQIEKPTVDRPHFLIAYGTKSLHGLKVFRDTEYLAVRAHARSRAGAKGKKREAESKITDMFPAHAADIHEATIDQIVEQQKVLASATLVELISKHNTLRFRAVVVKLLEQFILRQTDVKDICVALAKSGKIENTWGPGHRKPHDNDLIKLKA